MNATASRTPDAHTAIGNPVIAAIRDVRDGTPLPWVNVSGLPRYPSGDAHPGINQLALWVAQRQRGYRSSFWGSYSGWRGRGGQVRRDQRGTRVAHFERTRATSGRTSGAGWTLRLKSIFNAEQVDGIEYPMADAAPELGDDNRFAGLALALDTIVERQAITLQCKGVEAFYDPGHDAIRMPYAAYFSTLSGRCVSARRAALLANQCVRWTGHASRLDRCAPRIVRNRAAFESLVADIGAAFVCAQLGFPYAGVETDVHDLQRWVNVVKSDPRVLFEAARCASRACDYLLACATPARSAA